MKLSGKVAVITGASKGIGKAIALLFAKEGAKVVVNYSASQIEAEKVVEEIKKTGGEAVAIRADVSKPQEVQRLFEQTLSLYATIDILVNNAGIARRSPFMETPLEQWDEVLATNLTGVFLCAQEAARIMLQNKTGKIINMASVRGIPSGGNPSAIAYSVAKAGVISLTTTMAKELAPFITVNAVAPGFVETDLAKGWSKETRESAENVYLKRLIKPEEVAKAYLFLASDDATGITGQVLAVDGGYLLK